MVNEDAVRHPKRLIDARRYVLRSRWQDVQPRAREQNAFLKTRGHGARSQLPSCVGASGSMQAIVAPSLRSLKTSWLQGKSRRGPGSVPFGAAMDSSSFFLETARSTATTGAWP